MRTLAIIPARGGSKGINRKNLVEINGLPLVAHSIKHALAAKNVDRVIVSTDDEEMAEVSKEFGAEVPFLRPSELAEDHVLDLPVFEHALSFLKETEQYVPDLVLHLRPTTPFRAPLWIDESIQILADSPTSDSLRSVSLVSQHPYRVFEIDDSKHLSPIMGHRHQTPYLLRRQDLPKMYYYNCVIDLTRPQTIFDQASMTGNKILPFILDPEDVIDIDCQRDLELARFLFKTRFKEVAQ